MAFIHNVSSEATKPELNLFSLPPTQTSIGHGSWVHFMPIATILNAGPIEFVVPGAGDYYMDLAHTHLPLTARILNADGTNIADGASVGAVTSWLHSLFSQVDVFLNHKLVTPAANTYPYKAYIQTLLSYEGGAKRTHLSSALWYGDTASHIESRAANNVGYTHRAQYTAGSRVVDLYGPLFCDIFNVERLMLNEVELKVKLIRSKDIFSLMGDSATYQVQISDATLLVRKVKIGPKFLLAHSAVLAHETAKYPITRCETKAVTIPAQVTGKVLDNIFMGQTPHRIVIGLVGNTAFNGSIAHSPFNFDHHNLNFLSLYLNGEQIPTKPLQPDYANGLYIRSYNSLFSGTGIHYNNDRNDLTRANYGQGYTLYAFDLTPDLAGTLTTHWSPLRQGSQRVELGFNAPLANAVNCIIYEEFHPLIQVDKARNVSLDLSG